MIHLSTASFTWREAAGDRLWPAGPVEICLFRKNSGKNIRCQIQYSKWAGDAYLFYLHPRSGAAELNGYYYVTTPYCAFTAQGNILWKLYYWVDTVIQRW